MASSCEVLQTGREDRGEDNTDRNQDTEEVIQHIFFIGLTVIFIRIAKRTPIVFASAKTPANHDVAPVKLLK